MGKLRAFMILWCAMLMVQQPGIAQGPWGMLSDDDHADVKDTGSWKTSPQVTEETDGTTMAMPTGSPDEDYNIFGVTEAAPKGRLTITYAPQIRGPRFGSSNGRDTDFKRQVALARAKRRKFALMQKRCQFASEQTLQSIKQNPLMKTQAPMSPAHVPTEAPMASATVKASIATASSNASDVPFVYYNKVETPASNAEIKVFEMAIETFQLKPYDHSKPRKFPQDMSGVPFSDTLENGSQGNHSSEHNQCRQSSMYDMLLPLLTPLMNILQTKMVTQTTTEKPKGPVVNKQTAWKQSPFDLHKGTTIENQSPRVTYNSSEDTTVGVESLIQNSATTPTPFEMPKDQSLFELHKRQIIKKYKAVQRHLRQRHRHKESSLNNVDSARVPSFGSPMWEDQSPSELRKSRKTRIAKRKASHHQRHRSHQLHRDTDKGDDENSPKDFGMHKKPKIEHQSPAELHKRQQMAKKKAGYNQQRHSHKTPTPRTEDQNTDEDIRKFLAEHNPFKMNDSSNLEKILNSQRIKNPFQLHSIRVDHPTMAPYVTTTTPLWLSNVSNKEKKLPFELSDDSWVTPSYAEFLNNREAVMKSLEMPYSPPWEELQKSQEIKNQSPSVFPWHAAYPNNDKVFATPLKLHKIPKEESPSPFERKVSPVSEGQASLELHKSPKSESQVPFELLHSRENQPLYPLYPNNGEHTATPIKLHDHSPKIDYNKSPFETYQNPKLENQSPFEMYLKPKVGSPLELRHSHLDQPTYAPLHPTNDEETLKPLELQSSPPKENKSPFGMQHSPLMDNQSAFKMRQSTVERPLYPTYPRINAGIPKITEMNQLRNTVKKTLLTNPRVAAWLLDIIDEAKAIATEKIKKLTLKRQADSKKEELETFYNPKETIEGTAPVLTCPVRQGPPGKSQRRYTDLGF
ncbi:uncharacterized protein LOC117903096 [Drosophila subobscura]|uniref:uncharacterized protein LOC117903096 n=1 Tax=Drosophila subobscura TaxID=7241 RepID=UPI00155AC34F|nr:uncharacterized protein LOC117903096 [Drosophila subobscura]XP_034670798.1 uncharacterized protein LOC117903096 [Drosophila subobscura]